MDITATLDQRKTMAETVEEVSKQVFMPLTVGGGIKSEEAMHELLQSGADKISLNSAAINDPELITDGAKRFGSQCIVCAIDVKKDVGTGRYQVYSKGGTENTGLDAINGPKKPLISVPENCLLRAWTATGRNKDLILTFISKSARLFMFRSLHQEVQAKRKIFWTFFKKRP